MSGTKEGLGGAPGLGSWKQATVVLLLVVASAWQLSIVTQKTIIPWTKATWRTLDLNGMGRSARFFLGRAGAAYLDFLRSAVPEDSPIVIPPGAVQFSEQNVLQFYLMPRAAVGCPCSTQEEYSRICLDCLRASSHFVPAIGEFPSEGGMDGVKVLVPFESKYSFYRGVFAPPSSEIPAPALPWTFDGFPLVPLVLDLLAITLLLGVGATLAIVILDADSLRWVLPAAFPLGSGVLTWTVFLLGWAGLRLTAGTFVVGAALPLALAVGYGMRTGRLQAAWRALRRRNCSPGGFRPKPSA